MAIRPSARNRERIARLIGRAETHFRRVEGGYTPAERWLIASPGAPSVFAKIGTSKQTANALRAEYRVYSKLSGPFMPELLGWEDDPAAPILLIEGLGDARWPPPWDDGLVSRVVEALDALHHSEAELAPLDHAQPEPSPGWREVAEDPQPFLSLGLASPGWLAGALPELVAAEEALDPSGEAPVHLDVRSDNLCLTDRGVILIDWNMACLGNPELDLGFWLPSLEAEGGPRPEAMLPNSPEVAARVGGFFAARAGLPVLPYAPRVRTVQLQQLRTALPWAARALVLPSPG